MRYGLLNISGCLLVGVFVGTAFVGCGSDDSGDNSGNNTSETGGASGAGGDGIGGWDWGGAGGDAGEGGGGNKYETFPFKKGHLMMMHFPAQYYGTLTGEWVDATVMMGQFYPDAIRFCAESKCQTTVQGACTVTKCSETCTSNLAEPDDNILPSNEVSAGKITITGGIETVVLEHDAARQGYDYAGHGFLWSGGETLTVTAEGDVVPPFSVDVPGPPLPQLQKPDVTTWLDNLKRNKPIELEWESFDGAELCVMLDKDSSDKDPRAVSVQCRFDGSIGYGEVPVSAMGAFEAGWSGGLIVTGCGLSDIETSDWNVSVLTRSFAQLADGRWAYRIVTFE